MITVRGLDHVVVRVADLDRSLRFYRDALGFPIERRIDALGLVQLRAGDALIDLVPVDSPLGCAGGGQPDPKARNVDHFALRLARFDEGAIRALLARHAIAAGETAERYGAEGLGPSLYLSDPDGNTVELKGPAIPGTRVASPTASTATTTTTSTSTGAAAAGRDEAVGVESAADPATLETTKHALLEAAQEMDRAGLTEGTAGNLSARSPSGEIVVTPTALRYATMTLDDLVVTDLEGRVLAGRRAPTTELALHLACLRRHPEIGAVAHTHPVHASMFAVCQQPIVCAVEEVELYVGGDVPVTAYHRTGTAALGDAVAALVGDRAAALLANHGLVVVAATPGEAIDLTKLVERAATIMAGAQAIGKPVPLPESIRAEFRAAYLTRRKAGSTRP